MLTRLGSLLLFTAAIGAATPITDLANTGNGAAGTVDTRWQVKLNLGAYTAAYVTDLSGFPGAAWMADNATSSWVSPQARYFGACGGCSDAQNATYTYELLFQLPVNSSPGTAHFQIRVAADNQVQNVYLNGNALGVTYSGFGAFSSWVTVNQFFVNGQNTLEVATLNAAGTTGNPAGLRVEFQNSDVTPIPEPRDLAYDGGRLVSRCIGWSPSIIIALLLGQPVPRIGWTSMGGGIVKAEGPEMRKFLEATGNTLAGNELAVIGPETLDWFAILTTEKEEPDPRTVRDSIQKGALTILGFREEPRRNPATGRVEWALDTKEADGRLVTNWFTYQQKPEGLIGVQLVSNPREFSQHRAALLAVLQAKPETPWVWILGGVLLLLLILRMAFR